MKHLYIIAGCNGAGKTTASYTILPDKLDCREFVNADEIAKGLSPFQPERASIQAGRLMLSRIRFLLDSGSDFAFETTLATKSYTNLIMEAKMRGYEVTLLFFWLSSPALAVERVKSRVREGGHDIPEDVIRRRYVRGLENFFYLFEPIVHNWMFINNSGKPYEIVAKSSDREIVANPDLWQNLKLKYHG
ncbi:MAG: zeta toxin [Bacteroidetes bacterium]|nr:MAG: zeta toxin [Bacteroidota bacterium]